MPDLVYRSATLGLATAQAQVQNNPPSQPPATASQRQGPLTKLPRGERVH